jgi:hypothetical protein
MDNLAGRLANRVQLTTDGHHVYLQAVEDAFGSCASAITNALDEPKDSLNINHALRKIVTLQNNDEL